MIYQRFVKRIVDTVLSSGALFACAPLILLSILLIKISSPGPAFFTQTRVGRNRQTFVLFKLRTMSVDTNRVLSQTTLQDPEVFRVGKWLRRLKIDELPQIWNIIRGDMAIVGPRPCMPQTLEGMPGWAVTRFSTRPGMTGLSQVKGNASISWEARWE